MKQNFNFNYIKKTWLIIYILFFDKILILNNFKK